MVTTNEPPVHSPQINLVSFFSGYGGLEMGIRAAVGSRLRTVAYVEGEAYVVANLVQKMEQGRLDAAPVFTDVATFPYKRFSGLVDIACGGVPCQPHSVAGKQRGGSDERFLFDAFIDGLGAMQPKLVFIENVPGLLTSRMPDGTLCVRHIFNRLEAVGFCVEDDQGKPLIGIFSATEVGASHQRKRVFIMAYRKRSERWAEIAAECCRGEGEAPGWIESASGVGECGRELADDSRERGWRIPIQSRGSLEAGGDANGSREQLANGPSDGRGERRPESAGLERVDSVASDGGGVADSDCGDAELAGGVRATTGAEEGARAFGEPERRSGPLAEHFASLRRRGLPDYPPGPEDLVAWARVLRIEPGLAPALSKSAVRLLASRCTTGLGGDESSYRIDQLRALGNGVVAECAAKAFVTLLGKLIEPKL